MNRTFRSAVLFIFFLCSSAGVSAENDWHYQVNEGDTIWDICKHYVETPLCWKKLTEYNEVNNPKYLPPGTVIRIPSGWLKENSARALVIAVEGDVSVFRGGSAEGQKLEVHDRLSIHDTVKSGNGSAMIEFADQSRLLLKPDSTIRMNTLEYYQEEGVARTRIELLKGRVRSKVKELQGERSRYDVITPAAVAMVRGTEFRVATEVVEINGLKKYLTQMELLTGKLDVSTPDGVTSLEAGQATQVAEGKGAELPVSLLPRPSMALNGPADFSLPLEFSWNALEGAETYRVTLMKEDAQVWEQEVTDPSVVLDNIPEGDFELLIRGVDSNGFEGRNRRLALSLPEQ